MPRLPSELEQRIQRVACAFPDMLISRQDGLLERLIKMSLDCEPRMRVQRAEIIRQRLRKVCRSWRMYLDGTPGCTFSASYRSISPRAVDSIRMEFQNSLKPLPTCYQRRSNRFAACCEPCTVFGRLALQDVRLGCSAHLVKAIIDPEGCYTGSVSKYENLEMLAVRMYPPGEQYPQPSTFLNNEFSYGGLGPGITHLALRSYHPREDELQCISSLILRTLIVDFDEGSSAGPLFAPLSQWKLPRLEYLSICYQHGRDDDVQPMRREIEALLGNTGSTLRGLCLCVESAGERFYIPSDIWETCFRLESFMVYPHILRELPPVPPGQLKRITLVLKNLLASPYADATGEDFIQDLRRSRAKIIGIAKAVKMDLSWSMFERATTGGRYTFFAKIFGIFTAANLSMLDRYGVPLNQNNTPHLSGIRRKMEQLRRRIEIIELSDEDEIIEISDDEEVIVISDGE